MAARPEIQVATYVPPPAPAPEDSAAPLLDRSAIAENASALLRAADDSRPGASAISMDTAPHLPAPAVGPAPPATSALLGPLQFVQQTLNNCGPASIVEVLGFWGIHRSQADAQAALRGDNPYGMTTAGVPEYLKSLGMQVLLGTGGSQETVKSLLRAGFPVIANQLVSGGDHEFHYRPIDGFDDAKGAFVASDPFLGPNYAIGYDTFDQLWNYTGKRFMVVYPPDKHDELNRALAAAGWDASYAEGEASAQPWQIPDSGGPPPVTKSVLTGKDGKPFDPASTWFKSAVTLTLTAADPNGFGVATTSYQLDGAREELYRRPITIAAPGKHTLTYRSVAYDGGHELAKKLEVNIDVAPPSTVASVSAAGQLTLHATDDGSGVAGTTYSLNGGPPQTYSTPITATPGTVVTYASGDQAGNAEIPKALTIAAPSSPSATPPAGAAASSGASPAPPAAGAGYRVCPLFDQNAGHKSGGTLAIRLQLCDSAGKNVSSSAIKVTLDRVNTPPNGAKPPKTTDFRFDPGSSAYEADVTTDGLGQGVYVVMFSAAGDSASHLVQFRIQ